MSKKIKLFPHQEKAVEHAVKMINERRNSLIVAGTGAGKTIMMAEAIGRYSDGFLAENGRKPHVLVLVHRTEIHDQNHGKFEMVRPEIATSEITAKRKSLRGHVHFGMVQTVYRMLEKLEQAGSFFDMIVVDEVHRGVSETYREIVEWNERGNKKAVRFGVTATPNRADGMPLADLFDNFYQITTAFLIESHYLVRPKIKDFSPTFQRIEKKRGAKEEKVITEKGYIARNVSDDEEGKQLIRGLCLKYLEEKEDGKTVIFAPSHKFCGMIFKELSDMGRKPAYLHSGISDEDRAAERERFESGDAEELINVDIATEGYDFPPLRNIVDFDTNGSHIQWVQKVGRVLRTCPNKTSCTVIDFGGNTELYQNEGIEVSVNLEGHFVAPSGERLTQGSFFREVEEKATSIHYQADGETYTPYHLPEGMESILDKEFGVVYVACGEKADCIIVKNGESHILYTTNKAEIKRTHEASAGECMKSGLAEIGEIKRSAGKAISKMQIKMLAPEFPTSTFDWHSANCCICWKVWREDIRKEMGK